MTRPFLFQLMASLSVALTLAAMNNRAWAVPPTAEMDARMAGKWRVNGGGTERQYEISKGRNIKIQGGNLGEKRGKLIGQEDGSYIMKMDDDRVLKIEFVADKNELVAQVFRTEKEYKEHLAPMWKVPGIRVAP